ncbi:hypothetical protein PYCCODRAFT_1424236 [Trametes coccinea BRFM310]|uniref:C2H2-type domain-containing protein n=1 Tax=Trametes coccinea (strain BRFM310) TaxID=1353009 RepID=A0A1Y2IS58_TRAC3|nr:hypothetical protein PYCCODRAFT_1424236 [Trametes coccinea BRFM310]
MSSFHDGMEFVTEYSFHAAEYGDEDRMAERFDGPTSIFDRFLDKLDHPSAFADVGPTSESWGPYPSSHFAPSTSGPSILDETLYHPHNPTSPAFDSGAGGNGRHHGQPSARPPAPTTSSSVPPSSAARQSELQSSLSQVTTENWVFSASGTTVAGGQTSADGGRPHYSPLQDDEYVPPRARGNNKKPRLPQSSPAADGFGSSGAHPVYPAALHPSGSLHSPLSNSLTDFTTEGSLVASEAAADASLPQTKKRRRDIDNKENDIAHLAKKESLSRAMAILNSMSTSSHTSHWEEKPSSAGAAVGSLDESSQVYEHRAYGWLLPYENGVSSNEHLQESITNSYASPAWPSDNNSELNQAIASQDLVLHANALDVTGNDLGAGGEDHTGDLGAFYDVPESMPYTYPPPPPFLLTHGSESSLAAPAPVVSSMQHKPSSQTSPPAVVAPHDIHPGLNSAYTDFDLSVDEDNSSTAETPASQSQDLSTPPPLPAASHAHARATETPGLGAHQNGVRLVPPDSALSPQQLPALPSTTAPVITFANAWDPATQGAYPESNHSRTAERVRRRRATARVRTNPYPRSQHAARDGLPPSSSEAEKPESSSQGARRQAKSERASDSGGSFACPICGKHLQRRGDLPRHALWVGDHLDIKQMCVAQYHRDPCPVTRRDGAKRHWASAKCMGEEEFNRQYKKLDGEFGRLGLGESSASRKGRIMRRIGKQYLVVQVPCWKKHPKGKELPALLQLLKPEGHNELDRIRLLEEELREHGRRG